MFLASLLIKTEMENLIFYTYIIYFPLEFVSYLTMIFTYNSKMVFNTTLCSYSSLNLICLFVYNTFCSSIRNRFSIPHHFSILCPTFSLLNRYHLMLQHEQQKAWKVMFYIWKETTKEVCNLYPPNKHRKLRKLYSQSFLFVGKLCSQIKLDKNWSTQ